MGVCVLRRDPTLASQAPTGNAVVSERVESVQNLKDQLGRCRHLLQDRNVDPSFGKCFAQVPPQTSSRSCSRLSDPHLPPLVGSVWSVGPAG